ncbi:dTDP-4-dehydrorhamnose 3,5-epimerase [Oceanihabitans sediminis]|uniref:dTDP-4-dehydrorhamnose 3,5-epimerase n=1 Tax=Oceanihabitans sediminis TaxID=1812012 RepID=UPI003A909707
MKIEQTKLKDCIIIEPQIFNDNRGYFFESFNQNKFKQATGLDIDFIQDNESFSTKGVLRGLHFQKAPYAQSKLIRVIQGTILDVVVDLRKGSSTFGKYDSIELSNKNKKQLFIPKGFAHGFVVLSDMATVVYKCDAFYNKESEGGIIYNDPTLNIDWQLLNNELIISEKDKTLPTFEAYFK